MGVTIHFEGQLKSDYDFDNVMTIAKDFASENKMESNFFNESIKKLERVKDEKDWDYEGPVKGIKIQPDDNTDPLWLEFDKDNYIQEYCKTQFADINIHILLINFFKQIQPYFNNLIVIDEGEYWETNNKNKLQDFFDNYFNAAEKEKSENSKLDGPYRLENGRLIDLM
jgi:hypothetical protein